MSDNITYTVMRQIEAYIDNGFTILGSYKIVKKTELYNKFKTLYNSLPKEIIDNKDYIIEQHEENIFSLLSKINFMLEESKTYLDFIVINIKTIIIYIDKMYIALPEDIMICRKLNNQESV